MDILLYDIYLLLLCIKEKFKLFVQIFIKCAKVQECYQRAAFIYKNVRVKGTCIYFGRSRFIIEI